MNKRFFLFFFLLLILSSFLSAESGIRTGYSFDHLFKINDAESTNIETSGFILDGFFGGELIPLDDNLLIQSSMGWEIFFLNETTLGGSFIDFSDTLHIIQNVFYIELLFRIMPPLPVNFLTGVKFAFDSSSVGLIYGLSDYDEHIDIPILRVPLVLGMELMISNKTGVQFLFETTYPYVEPNNPTIKISFISFK